VLHSPPTFLYLPYMVEAYNAETQKKRLPSSAVTGPREKKLKIECETTIDLKDHITPKHDCNIPCPQEKCKYASLKRHIKLRHGPTVSCPHVNCDYIGFAEGWRTHLLAKHSYEVTSEAKTRCPHESCKYAGTTEGLISHLLAKHTSKVTSEAKTRCPHANCKYAGLAEGLRTHLRAKHRTAVTCPHDDCKFVGLTAGLRNTTFVPVVSRHKALTCTLVNPKFAS